jgi:glycosyltransferase involved in cell wall biosynthesis
MKICILAPEFLPVWGGVGTYIIELVRHLPKDMEIHVVTPFRESLVTDKSLISNFDFSRYFGSNVHVHYISKANDTFSYNAKFQYACFKHVPKLLKEEQIDLIHSHTAQMPDLLLMFRKLGKPIITTVHTTIKSQRLGTRVSQKTISQMERSEKATYILYPFLRFAEEVYFKRKRFLISPSNWMERFLKDNYHINGSVRVIPNSVDMNDYVSKKNDEIDTKLVSEELKDRKLILYVGRLLAMKGVDNLIAAIPEILKRLGERKFLFVFAGPGDRVWYLTKIKELKIESSCLFTGPLPREKVIQLMKNAELVVAPSFIENAPYTILESMACGVPVIASNVGGVSEIIKDGYNGSLVEVSFPEAIANSVVNLLEDTSLRSVMGKNAKETIHNNFSWSVNLKKYCEAYSDALNQNGQGIKCV